MIILNKGEVIAEGTVAEIKRKAAPQTARVRVSSEGHERAISVLRQAPGVAAVDAADGGWMNVTFDRASMESGQEQANNAIRALLDAGVPIVSFELEGGRLSDAFLHLTGEGLT